jgi:uncharacterized protein (DUF1501 family)
MEFSNTDLGETLMFSRRTFLKSTLLALAPTVPGFLARTARAASPQRDGRVLVVIELNGGNDGINTVVPYADEGYAKHRRLLRLPKTQLIKIDDRIGLHPQMAGAGKLLESGRLAVVQGVGYPNPNRSHFESMAIWQTARFDLKDRDSLGWLGRGLDEAPATGGMPSAVFVSGGQMPTALQGRRAIASGLTRPEDFVLRLDEAKRTFDNALPADDLAAFVRRNSLDAYVLADRMAEVLNVQDKKGSSYPSTDLAEHLRLIARLIKASIGTRIYYTKQSGYDTHAGQQGTHAGLLQELSAALLAFLDDLAAAKAAERVVVLTFSEFGRTVRENASAGTDHGTSGPVFLAGPGVKAGPIGATPSLLDLDPKHGDLRMAVDFRQVYATVLQDWLGLPAKTALAGDFERLPLFKV